MPNNYKVVTLLSGLLLYCITVEASEQKLCDAQSTPVFKCEVSNGKNIALCADYDQLGELKALQYRFGRSDNLELIYPANIFSSIDQFRFNQYFRFGVEYTKISFSNGSFKYGIFKNSDENEAEGTSFGVEITDERSPAAEVRIVCRKIFEDKLRDFSNLSCDEEDALGCVK